MMNDVHGKGENSLFKYNVFYENDGSCTISIDGFDVVENGGTFEEAMKLAVDGLMSYIQEYLFNIQVYKSDEERMIRISELISKCEDGLIIDLIKEREGNDDGVRYTLAEVKEMFKREESK